MSLDTAISEVVKSVPECVAAGFVDMSTGMLLGIKTVDSHLQEVLDLVAAATGDLFQGGNVTMIEKLFRKERGLPEDNHHFFKEILVLSDNLLHVFLRGKSNSNQCLVVVCRVSANIGMVLTKTRQALPTIEAAV